MEKIMKNTRANIPGYGRYKLDLIVQDIISKDGNIIQPRVSINSKKGDLVVSLTDDNDKRQTVNYLKLVKKTVESLEFTPVSASILSEVLVAYYNRLTPEFKKMTLQEVSREVNIDVPAVEVLKVGSILSKIHTSEKS